MKKQKKTKKSDEETLKHYMPNENFPDPPDQPHLEKIRREMLAAKPVIVVPDLSVDHILAKRKTPVIAQVKKNKKP